MTNFERYKNKILDFIKAHGFEGSAVVNGRICRCCDVRCAVCMFARSENCRESFHKWLNSEYEEPKIDWGSVDVDTKIFVKDSDGGAWLPRYFAGYDAATGRVLAFVDGRTSWSSEGSGDGKLAWKFAKLAEGVE